MKCFFIVVIKTYHIFSLRRGPGSNVQDSSGYSALHHAALNGHRYESSIYFKIFISKLLYLNNSGEMLTNREIVVLLLEHEASPNIVDSKGSSPLHLAAWAGHSDIVRLLLTTGVRVTQIDLRVSPKSILFLFESP